MKNQYFGDINDYLKYGLLRCITEASGMSIGVCWMLTNDDGGADGQERAYLDNPKRFRHYDPELFDRLLSVRSSSDTRDVGNARRWDLLPDATYFDEPLGRETQDREYYFSDALRKLAECPLVFLDPDIGIAGPSHVRGRSKSGQVVFWDEIAEFYRRGHSLVIYQHYPRKPRDQFLQEQTNLLQSELDTPLVLLFRTARVVFLLAARPEHADYLAAVADVVSERWPGQITPWAPASIRNRTISTVECLDCGSRRQRRPEVYEADGTSYCRHFSPEYWERRGYRRDWGDAAVMNWPHLEILRRETVHGCEFLILAPNVTRRPVVLESADPEAWGSY